MKKKTQLPSLKDHLYRPLNIQELNKVTGGIMQYCKTLEEVVVRFKQGCPPDSETGTPESNYGRFGEVRLTDIALLENFIKLGRINKSQISICKVCEFRRICPDCRGYTIDKTTSYSKPSKCEYDPYTASWRKPILSIIFFVLLNFICTAQRHPETTTQYYDSIVFYQEKIPKYRELKTDSVKFVEDKLIYYAYKFIDTISHAQLDDDKRKAITWLSDVFSTRGFNKSRDLFKYVSRYYPDDIRLKAWLLGRLDTNRNFRSKEFLTKHARELKNILQEEVHNDQYNKLKFLLELTWDRDQFYRKEWQLVKKNNDHVLQLHFADSIAIYDRKNLEVVEDVLKKYGWPSPSQVGYKASQAIFLVFHHSDTATFFKYFNEVEKAYRLDKIAKADYELYKDRYYSRKFGYQIFGTQSYFDSTLKKIVPYPIKNDLNMNKE